MRRLSRYDAENLVAEYVKNRTLEDLLEELKMYGKVTITHQDYSWNIEFLPKVKNKEYKLDNYGKDLLQLVKDCLSIVYFSQALN